MPIIRTPVNGYHFTADDEYVFESGGAAQKCVISSGASITIGEKATASGNVVCNGGYFVFSSGGGLCTDTVVSSGGILKIDCGTQVEKVTAVNGAKLKLTMAGEWYKRPSLFSVTSNGVLIASTATTSTTDLDIIVRGFTGWDMKTPGCSLKIIDFASAAFVKVSSGCELIIGSSVPYGAGAAGKVDVYNGGRATLYKAKGVELATVHSGGSMTLGSYSEDVTVMENGGYLELDESILTPDEYYDPNLRIKPNAFFDLVLSGSDKTGYARATVHSGTTAVRTTVKEYGWLEAFNGGRVVSAAVSSGGEMFVSSGGTAVDTVVNFSGYLTVSEGGVARNVNITNANGGKLIVSSGGKVTGNIRLDGQMLCADEAILDFDISALSPNNAVLVTNCSNIATYGIYPIFTLTVSDSQAKGTYKLATKAYQFGNDNKPEEEKTLIICDTSGTKLGAVISGKKALIGDQTYALHLNSGDLTITVAAYVEGEEIWSEKGNGADGGSNNWLYKKNAGLNPEVGKFVSTPVSHTTQAVLLDKALSKTIDKVSYRNYVGEDDGADFAKITLTSPAKLSLTVKATEAVKFTLWHLVPGRNDTYTMQALKSVSAKKGKKETIYTATLETPLLGDDTYYVSVEASTKKGYQAYYNVSVNQAESVFYTKGINTDDWDDFRENGPAGQVGSIGTLSADSLKSAFSVILTDWVGFTDPVDCKKFTVNSAAALSFLVEASDVSKFTLYMLNDPDKKGNYSRKAVFSTKLGKNPYYGEDEDESAYYALAERVILEQGDYYICMESTNAAKGGSADYTVSLVKAGSEFFTKGNSADDWDDLKEKGKSGKVGNAGAVTAGANWTCTDWVGCGDEIDYKKITLGCAAKLSFTVKSDDTVKFMLCKLNEADKKGNYSLKTLLAAASKKAGRNAAEYTATTKTVLLDAADYYLCVSMPHATAAKGGSASYEVSLNPDDKIFFSCVDDKWNNWLYDKTKEKKNEEPRNLQVVNSAATAITSTTKEILLDKKNSVNVNGRKNFVGYGDDTDFGKISLAQSAKVSFTINATDAAKFTICSLVYNEKKKTYSVKTILSAALKKADKNSTEYTTTTKPVQLADGIYYVSVESTNAKKGGNAYYNVEISSFEAVPAKDKAALLDASDACALTAPEESDGRDDIFASAESGLTDAYASAESGLMLLSGADLADLRMSEACDPAVSPVPVDVSDDLFAGLLNSGSGESPTEASVSVSAGFRSDDDAMLRPSDAVLA